MVIELTRDRDLGYDHDRIQVGPKMTVENIQGICLDKPGLVQTDIVGFRIEFAIEASCRSGRRRLIGPACVCRLQSWLLGADPHICLLLGHSLLHEVGCLQIKEEAF